MIEISPVPLDLSNSDLEGLVRKALTLTENEVHPNDLEASLTKELVRFYRYIVVLQWY